VIVKIGENTAVEFWMKEICLLFLVQCGADQVHVTGSVTRGLT